MYDIAEVVADQISARRLHCPSYKDVVESLPADDRADFEERAAIMENDGRLSRSAAETAALVSTIRPISAVISLSVSVIQSLVNISI